MTSLYLLIRNELTKEIAENVYPAGTKLPSTAALMERFGTSSTTVSRAMEMMAREGVVRRMQGAGTFVTGRRVFWETQEAEFIAEKLARFKPVYSRSRRDRIAVPVPNTLDQIDIMHPMEHGRSMWLAWPFWVQYVWPNGGVRGVGKTLDLALFQTPQDVVGYVHSVIARGGLIYSREIRMRKS